MLKSFMVGVGAGFLGLAGAAITPILVGVVSAVGGAAAVLGLYAWRTFRKRGRERDTSSSTSKQTSAAPVAGHAQDVRP